jgi:hypothetical protein
MVQWTKTLGRLSVSTTQRDVGNVGIQVSHIMLDVVQERRRSMI